ncbi:MAG: phosphoglycerate kinase [Fimbriimonadaceae bacterium]|nr:phosphoglycerate kinase [Alphaproteobacteria bacterium]
MNRFRTLDDVDVAGKRVLVRLDLNVPVQNGRVTDTTRIDRVVPTLREITAKGGSVLILSHFGRPKGQCVADLSLEPVAGPLSDALGSPVRFVATDWRGEGLNACIGTLNPGDVVLLENTRFSPGEEANDEALAKRMASLGDIFVNDAFSAAHRAHASTTGIAAHLPAYAGRAMQAELSALEAALSAPKRPVLAIVGGAKISSKLALLGNLSAKVDGLIIGGGMANTFLAANGINVGNSLCETDLLETARDIQNTAQKNGCEIILPVDALVAKEFKANAASRVAHLDDIATDDMILDVGPETVGDLNMRLGQAATLVWNGPLGAFEITPFDSGTVAVARYAAAQTLAGDLVSIAGGGDTVAALGHAGIVDDFSYVSTAGGAFLEWLEGKELPGVKALERSAH